MQINVMEYLLKSVEESPDKVAFCDEEKSYTFLELDRRAREIAGMLMSRLGMVRNEPIAVYMEKGVECIAAFMGVVYSGNYYSPIDIHTPHERIKMVLETLKPKAILIDGSVKMDKEEQEILNLDEVFDVDESEGCGKYCDLEWVQRSHLDVDPLYVLFTSGSTGKPKGVVINHRAVIDYSEWLGETFRFSGETVFGNQAPFYFDNSILDIYQTLRNGAKMVIIPERNFMYKSDLIEYMNRNKVNTIFWVPSLLTSIADSGILEKKRIEYLKNVLFCGEIMPVRTLNKWRKCYSEALYANLYGPTEITDVCAYYIVDREFSEEESLPIGRACRNTEIIVLNEENKVVQCDEAGELCVRGCCLALGYLEEYEKTEEVFVQNPLNVRYRDLIYRTGDMVKYNEYGELIYLCRKDSQIKYQGHRIELGEIDCAAYSIEGIKQACAVFDGNIIILFCSILESVTERHIFAELRNKIPNYMLPKKIVTVAEIPLNKNGKLDRVWLKTQY